MLGLNIRAVGESRTSLIKILNEIIEEIECGSNSMILPLVSRLNDTENTDATFSICDIGSLGLFDGWHDCPILTQIEDDI